MVNLDSIRRANRASYRDQPLVAVFAGATTGIGEYAVRALSSLCSNQSNPIRIYIVGRNPTVSDKITSECARVCPHADFRFVKANDLVSIKDVDRLCAEITRIETEVSGTDKPRIDLLVMTQGRVEFGPRLESSEGLDRSMSLLYYSRIRMILNLLPLLLNSSSSSPNPRQSTPARIISIFGAGLESTLHTQDLSLRNPKNWAFATMRSHVVHMTTMAFEHLAKQHPGQLSLVHQFPGLVITPAYTAPHMPAWFKAVWFVVGPLVKLFFAISAQESGERTLFLGTGRFAARTASRGGHESGGAMSGGEVVATSTDGVRGGGAYAVNEKCETVTPKADYAKLRSQGFEDKVWSHTMQAFAEIEAGRKFVD